ncbi:MAG: hypothetical protein ACRECO_06230 [Xanthobacteraceae bacterium]
MPVRGGSIERRRAVLVCSILIAIVFMAIGFYARDARPLRAAAMTEDDLTTGSIVFVPTHGNRCRNSLIDNATWRIRDNGYVDCRTALSRNANVPRLNWSTARTHAIRQGFTARTP